jgi:acetoacetate decarboxylase
MMLEYLIDRAAAEALLPDPLRPAEEPRAAAIFGWWQSCSAERDELRDSVRSQYHEFYFALECEYEGRRLVRCPFCWVDKDFSLVRGLIQGYPKKLGSISMTRPVGVGRAGARLGAGAEMHATLAVADRRLVELSLVLEEPVEEAPFSMTGPLVHSRIFPSWAPGGQAVDELVLSECEDQELAGIWRGTGSLGLTPSPHDEIGPLRPLQPLAAYRLEFAETLVGGALLGDR